ncbi:unnamed protein product [Rotaria sp. Silwood1]|nr:unnamed protein product [Rotaria sp. Silwood1]
MAKRQAAAKAAESIAALAISLYDVSIQLNPPITYPFLITCFDGGCYYGVALTFFKQFNNDDGTCSESSFATAIISLNCLIEKL